MPTRSQFVLNSRFFISLLWIGFAFSAMTQEGSDKLTLEKAIEKAKQSNGTIMSAYKQYQASRAAVTQANASFFPVVTPLYRFSDQKQTFAGGFTGTGVLSFHQLSLGVSWLVLDGGQRFYALSRSRKSAEALGYSALWTLRQVFFEVATEYYEVLRARELLRAADAQAARAKQILEVTQAQVEIGAAAQKDILQAKADLANAIVAQMTAKNRVTTAEAALKATIGWEKDKPLPELVTPELIAQEPSFSLQEAIERGERERPDLLNSKKRLEATRFDVLTARRNASLDWELTVNFTRNFEPEETENRSLTFTMTYPLFDGGLSRAVVKERELSYEAERYLLEQQIREIRSEIESAYFTWLQNREVLDASNVALEAARLNFAAASESQKEGVSSILDVTNAQVALVTAETNFVNAHFDFIISEMQLRLVTGQSMPGETS
ncbi:MAG TPA: TolC family protein [Fimbriimonadales bacterium]|nr:TolC family protein [Fimbriimonadales bacterium]